MSVEKRSLCRSAALWHCMQLYSLEAVAEQQNIYMIHNTLLLYVVAEISQIHKDSIVVEAEWQNFAPKLCSFSCWKKWLFLYTHLSGVGLAQAHPKQ